MGVSELRLDVNMGLREQGERERRNGDGATRARRFDSFYEPKSCHIVEEYSSTIMKQKFEKWDIAAQF
jgi:hypothetical protein